MDQTYAIDIHLYSLIHCIMCKVTSIFKGLCLVGRHDPIKKTSSLNNVM